MISIEHVTKTFGHHTRRHHRAVDDVSFVCPPGSVTGFLGPNGAGKSTTLRILTGLASPDSGQATIGGVAYRDIPNPARQVGVLLDASAQHAGRTGAEVLRLGALTMGLPATRVSELFDLVGLSAREARRRVRDYSLGMRQRLGIAHALLGDPAVLVLDEPVNGLDPAGIHWMRRLLRHHADRGGTVLLSSHLLREVEAIADQIVVIGGGRVVASGPAAELLAGEGTRAAVIPEHRTRLIAALDETGIAVTPTDDATSTGRAGSTEGAAVLASADAETIGRLADRHRLVLTELRAADGHGIEELFLQLTGGPQQTGAQRTDVEQIGAEQTGARQKGSAS